MTDPTSASLAPRRFAVVGGDLRMLHLCRRLTALGHAVSALGCGEDCLPHPAETSPVRVCATLRGVTEGADALVLPLPATRDGVNVHCPRDPSCALPLEEIAALLRRETGLLLYGGRLPDTLAAGELSPRVVDYYEDEALQLRNAYLTAEAALMTAMELTDTALQGLSAGIVGYGRIGKALSRLLQGLGVEVTVFARREEALSEAAAAGCRPRLLSPSAPMGGFPSSGKDFSILFNTVPAPIIPRETLVSLDAGALLIDLASAPFGVSDEDVREATARGGLRYLRAPSLPGSYAPRTAGEIIADCVLADLSRRDPAPHSNENGGIHP